MKTVRLESGSYFLFEPSLVPEKLVTRGQLPAIQVTRKRWAKLICLGTPSIAGQSRSNRGPTDSNRGATLVIAAVSVRFSLSYLKRWPSSIHTWKLEGSDIARMGRALLVTFVQSPSNRRPTRNSAAKL